MGFVNGQITMYQLIHVAQMYFMRKGEPMDDTISRQAAIDALWAERMKHSEEMERNLETCSFALRADNKARRNRVEEDIEIIKQLPPAQPEIDILEWLLAYHTKSFELRGRYLPHEVIGWLIADFSKQYMPEGNENKEGPC